MNYQTFYRFSDITLCIEADMKIENRDCSGLFEYSRPDIEWDFLIQVCEGQLKDPASELPAYSSGKRKSFIEQDRLLSYYRQPNKNWQFCYEELKNKGILTALPQYKHYLQDVRNIWDKIDFSRILLFRNAMILHASYISYNGHGILFTAPSGTGKSTQARLWEQYRGAEIVNGDRAILSNRDGRPWVHSLPFSGSSGICKNISCPLKAIVVLGQAEENRIRKLSKIEGMKHLYSQCALNRWNREEVEIAISLLGEFVQKIPVLKLECLPDRSAVEILEAYLKTMMGEK